MSEKFSVVYMGESPNEWVGGNRAEGICDHIMEGTMGGTNSCFMNASFQASANYGVGKDGRIWQWVLDSNRAWAEGIVNNPDHNNPLVHKIVDINKDNPNNYLVSIEHEGNTGIPLTEVQYQASLWLHRHLIAAHGIPADRDHILGHYQFDSVNRPFCPGMAFPWQRLIADLSTTVPIYSPPPPVVDPNVRLFPETGFYVNNDFGFLNFWNQKGGLDIFGLPIGPAFYNPGFDRVVQYFERARFEAHSENADPYKVQLGQLGTEQLKSVSEKATTNPTS